MEVQDVEERSMPEYAILLGMDEAGLNYLKEKKAIVSDSDKDILAIMPLTTTFTNLLSNGLLLHTDQQDLQLIPSNDKLNMFLDIQALSHNQMFFKGSESEFFNILSSFELTFSASDEINAVLQFKSNRTALAQLFRKKL